MTAIDQDIRDRAIREVDTSFALSAGAGSGKTSVLTARIVARLAAGTPPARIAAITFTEKAAGELKERVRDALEARAAEDPALDRALAELPELTLSTIHSFALGLLTAEALEAGWAPGTEILPDVVSSPEVRAAFLRWESSFRARHPAAGLVVRAMMSSYSLEGAARRLLAWRDLEPVVAPPFDPERAFAGLQEVAARLEEAARACKAANDKLLVGNRGLLELLRAAAADEPVEGVVRVLCSGERPRKTGGRKGDWVGDGKLVFVEALEDYDAWHRRQCVALHGLVVADLRARFLPEAEAAKARAGVADYDDLLFRAAEVLAHPEARARLAGRYDALLIDEVQDTDPIQAEVAALLARASQAEGPWNAHPPGPGRLFAVGDPRQSIYRFRRADVETWADLQRLIELGGESLSLTQNFRSVPGIVAWVNRTCADLPGYVPQVAFRGPAALDPVVRLASGEEREVADVARYLCHLRDTGRVVDRDTRELRPLRWSDVMILLPAWSKAEEVQQVLARAGVPCLVEGGGAFFRRDEVRLSLAALRALEDPAEEQATVFALRGLFGLTWEDLARHRAAGGSWRYTVGDPPPGPVGEAFAVLRELGRLRGRRSWVALLDALLERTRAAAVWSVLRDGEARLANLDKLRALIRRVEAAARSPGDALRALADLDQEKDLSRVDLDSDAVRVTSYFKAKGLEAPVIVLCHARRNASGVSVAVDRKARKVAIKAGGLVPPDWERREEAEKAAMDAERARWMYVAATRARDQLVLVDASDKSLIREHLGRGLEAAVPVDPAELPEPPWRDETFPGHDEAVDAWLLAEPAAQPDPTEGWQAALAASVRSARSASTRWRSVQEVAVRERVSHASSPVGVVGGTLVHDVMEVLDLGRPVDALLAEVDALVEASAAELGVDEEKAALCADIVRGMLRHPVIARARSAPERWTEVPFSIHHDGRVVSGRIDLAFPVDASRRAWVVVDWKSDLPARGTAGWRNYERQLGWYAKALLQTVSPCEHVETVLVGPHPELARDPTAAESVADQSPELAPGLQAWLDRGRPAPRVGADLAGAVAALAWDDRRVALCVGQPAEEVRAAESAGWTVIAVDPVGLTWADEALAAAAEALGLAD